MQSWLGLDIRDLRFYKRLSNASFYFNCYNFVCLGNSDKSNLFVKFK
ncbi:hypothetical protein CAMRE0001_1058 [Campylobacter rectus RM3267]|uniref:Uncharacterized protein n=1 Tax=Campylobacter rectus RM3267 TaxID=553218 RepID=B9D630_CAMRE|nr:hypothetical protein CAMRE0001_1058 [Campylobacter rectus RM3267]